MTKKINLEKRKQQSQIQIIKKIKKLAKKKQKMKSR